jgi:hypothetical protein
MESRSGGWVDCGGATKAFSFEAAAPANIRLDLKSAI